MLELSKIGINYTPQTAIKKFVVNLSGTNAKQKHAIEFLNHFAQNGKENEALIKQSSQITLNLTEKLDKTAEDIFKEAGVKFKALA